MFRIRIHYKTDLGLLHLDPVPRGKKINEKNSQNNKKKKNWNKNVARNRRTTTKCAVFSSYLYFSPSGNGFNIFNFVFFYHLLSIFSAKNILKQILMFDSLIKFNFLIL